MVFFGIKGVVVFKGIVAQDLLSAVYYSRCINYDKMKIGDVYNMDVFMDGETYPIYIRYKGKENIKTDFGTFRCTKIS